MSSLWLSRVRRRARFCPACGTELDNGQTEVGAPPPKPDRSAKIVVPNTRHPLVAAEVRVKIEAIEAEARCLRWPAELLWNGNFWDSPRGLAAVIDPDDEIVEVTAEYIAILRMRRDLLRFRRHVA
jgi:hypothetical protein